MTAATRSSEFATQLSVSQTRTRPYSLLRFIHFGFDGEVAEIPVRIVHAGIFPIDNPHAFAVVEEVFRQGIAVAGGDAGGMTLRGSFAVASVQAGRVAWKFVEGAAP